MKTTLLLLTLLAGSCSASYADYIYAVAYTATPGQGRAQGGTYNYFDDTGAQLTDGVCGEAKYWLVDLGNGPAYEWVGWRANPVLSFEFGTTVEIRSVAIGFDRSLYSYINLPGQVRIGDTYYTFASDVLADLTRDFLVFNGDWVGTSLEIDLTRYPQAVAYWIFVDEIQFQDVTVSGGFEGESSPPAYYATPLFPVPPYPDPNFPDFPGYYCLPPAQYGSVPDAGSAAGLLGLGILGLAGFRRLRQHRPLLPPRGAARQSAILATRWASVGGIQWRKRKSLHFPTPKLLGNY